jgi:hypothetical protein
MVDTASYAQAFRETRTTASGVGSTKRSVIQSHTAAFSQSFSIFLVETADKLGKDSWNLVHGPRGWRLRFAAEMHNSGERRCGLAEVVRGRRSSKRTPVAHVVQIIVRAYMHAGRLSCEVES